MFENSSTVDLPAQCNVTIDQITEVRTLLLECIQFQAQ